MTGARDEAGEREPLAAASVTIAWAVLLNKPFYPLYVWGLVGAPAAMASRVTLFAAPAFAALPWLARRKGFAARMALPLVGIADTLLATTSLGRDTGAAFFLFPCLMLAALVFRTREVWTARAIALLAFLAFAAIEWFVRGNPLALTSEQATRWSNLNFYSVIALSAFIALRFSSAPRD